jgi:hypothetical protein
MESPKTVCPLPFEFFFSQIALTPFLARLTRERGRRGGIAFDLPTILPTESFGNLLWMQRTVITSTLEDLYSSPLPLPPLSSAAATLTQPSTESLPLSQQLALHAETLDRAASRSRRISTSPTDAKMRQDVALHAWTLFLGLRRRFREVVAAREEAMLCVLSWRAWGRWDEAPLLFGDEDEEPSPVGGDEGVDEGEEVLLSVVRDMVDAGTDVATTRMEWTSNAVEILSEVTEAWAARWLWCKFTLHPPLFCSLVAVLIIWQ